MIGMLWVYRDERIELINHINAAISYFKNKYPENNILEIRINPEEPEITHPDYKISKYAMCLPKHILLVSDHKEF